MTAVATPYQIRCAEIWGGASVKEDEIATPGVHAAIHSSAGGDTKGGDLYYFSVCGYDALTRIAIADVRGHGEAVSHLSDWLYKALEARMNDADGAAVLTELNRMVRSRGFEAITTAVVAKFHRDKQLLHYAYAGHPPLVLGRAGRSWQPLEPPQTSGPTNLPLGIMAGTRFTQETVRVEPGDRLFLYTDGVAECPGPGDELYGDEKMLAALNRAAGRPLDEIRQDIHQDLVRFAGGNLNHDDCTFLLLEVLEPLPIWKRRFLPGRFQSQ